MKVLVTGSALTVRRRARSDKVIGIACYNDHYDFVIKEAHPVRHAGHPT